MDALADDQAAVADDDAINPRATLVSIVEQCDHALADRIAKRFSTRDSLKSLRKRAQALLDEESESRAWMGEFEKVVTTANAVFEQLIAEVEPAGHA